MVFQTLWSTFLPHSLKHLKGCGHGLLHEVKCNLGTITIKGERLYQFHNIQTKFPQLHLSVLRLEIH